MLGTGIWGRYVAFLVIFLEGFVGLKLNTVIDPKEGERQYSLLLTQTKLPQYGGCWKNALTRLHSDCERLTSDSQSRLALAFANCFLENSAMRTYTCDDDEDFRLCTKDMDSRAFTTYTTFFTHIQNICYFLKSKVWQEETENVIDRLVIASHDAASRMNSNLQLQKTILKSQEKSLENEQQLLNHRVELNYAIEQSKSAVQDMLDSTAEQRLMFSEIFHQIAKLRSLAFGEIAGVYTLLYYFFCLPFVYLLTAAKRTESARLWLTALLILSLVAERVLTNRNLDYNIISRSDQIEGEVNEQIWLIRRIYMWLTLIVLIICSYKYRDMAKINFELLQEISQSNHELKQYILSGNIHANETPQPKVDATVELTPINKDTPNISGNRAEIPVQMVTPQNVGRPRKVAISEPSLPRYSLRSRKPLSPLVQDSSLNSETPEAFEHMVHHLADINRQRSIKIRKQIMEEKTQMRSRLGTCLSSDDDA